MIKGNTVDEVHELLEDRATTILETSVDNCGYSIAEIEFLNQDDLQNKLNKINELLADSEKLKQIGFIEFRRGKDYYLPEDVDPDTVGYGFYPYRNLMERKKLILELIKTKSRNEKITSLEDLIDNIGDLELREKIETELKELNQQTTEIEAQEKKLNAEEKKYESSKKQLEISKTKLEILEKKSQIWLSILAKESIASIIGALLLIIIAICLLISMFLGIETTDIIKSAFLLILGYFFGHAVSKK